jgi:pimeloyl-ACP methyl ester carboxylesterase
MTWSPTYAPPFGQRDADMWFEVDGRRVLATTGGVDLDRARPLVLFVHGAGHDRTVWALQTRYFAHHGYAVLAVDLPGHGRSEGPAPDSIAGFAGWLDRFLDAAGFPSAHLVGHSMGSLVTLELAATHPDRAVTLTLLGTSAGMVVHPDLLAAAEHGDHLAYDLISGWSLSPAGHRGGHPTPGQWMMGASNRLLERSQPGVLASDLAACAAYDRAEARAAAIGVRTLLILGERDLMTRPKHADPITAGITGAQTVLLERTGHAMMMERPDAIIDTLADFLGG